MRRKEELMINLYSCYPIRCTSKSIVTAAAEAAEKQLSPIYYEISHCFRRYFGGRMCSAFPPVVLVLLAAVIFFSAGELEVMRQKPVFAAMRDRLIRAYPALDGAEVFDYAARDDFAVLNAVPTAEGAVEVAMREYEGTVFGSRTLVTGFGRIGKILAKMLKALGSDVTVCARKPSDFAYIEALGYHAKNTASLSLVHGYDIVFNTVPALIFDETLLKNTDEATLLIDLASLPGGVDFEAARKLGVDAHRALSLPGKCAPKSAGEIIKKTVFSIIEEVNR